MGATSRRNVTFGVSAADSAPAAKSKNSTGGSLRSMGRTSGYLEWNHGSNHRFVALVRADTTVDIQIVKAGIGCLRSGDGETAGGHVDYPYVFGADNVHARSEERRVGKEC